MKTVFSLTYFECPKSVMNLNDQIIGPQLFINKDNAIGRLYDYVKARLTNGLDDVMKLYIEERNWDDSVSDAYVFIENSNTQEMLALSEYFFDFMKCDDTHVGFKITELPVTSFEEQLYSSNAIEINGHFSRHYHLASPDELLNNDYGTLLDVKCVDNSFREFQYEFSFENVKDATYDSRRKLWVVKGLDVKLFCYS
ncbi:hypothetical protein [Moritella sp. F3]|uniref:hypothetical protein n=1 Tax=Moritella sp. F3 TaxID=2718882 RepID=UPI0018E168EC|nr:hypothetical protein [Moritella sp. F3]GIC77633.1 hypothetical protein FMO001_23600 [Moritella sp. F1]GIC82046.1 hypothetical protein FMO003_23270 [Moritella sp. F3]